MLKEQWLFGKLQTVGTSEAETRAETAAAKVAEGLSRLQKKKSDKRGAIGATERHIDEGLGTFRESGAFQNGEHSSSSQTIKEDH